jgi:excinuclease ABC subunit C
MQEISLLDSIQNLPHKPGIYQYFDENSKLLYVGKAKDLSKRVKSYFRFTSSLRANPNLSLRILKMLDEMVSLEYIVVQSEHDALILENSLIKQLNPKYNILLRDDKTYPYIYIDHDDDFPRFEITRKVIRSKNIKYFGPYSTGARDILDSIYELCALVQKKSCIKSKKACLYYQIKRCHAPCEGKITPSDYNRIVQEAYEYIQNKSLLLKELNSKMQFYAENLRFEEASILRDRIEKISKSEIKSSIDLAQNVNLDIFALSFNDSKAIMVVMFVRDGKIISTSSQNINLHFGVDIDEIYARTLINFYGVEKPPVTPDILTFDEFESVDVVSEHLEKLFERKVKIATPKRGLKHSLITLAKSNADEILNKKSIVNLEVQKSLQELCMLDKVPIRIEVFDNSHFYGSASVGAMITYDESDFDKSSYRLYHLEAKDEYAQMRETLTRRVESFEKNPPPDLWIIDGGTTLLKLAKDIIDSCAVNLDVIAISKEKIDAKSHRAKGKANDELHDLRQTHKLKSSDKRLQFVQKLRDEAHRSAITFHKKSKVKQDQEGKLLQVNGISEAKQKRLLNYFGSFENIKNATQEELQNVVSANLAQKIIEAYED